MAAELPVRTITLYKHGIGYFERSGTLAAGETARLEFKAEQMSDVLKSLTITDQRGPVAGVRYDSAEPAERKLSDFPFQIKPNQPLSVFLDQLRGARLRVRTAGSEYSGSVVGGRLQEAGDDTPPREQLTLLNEQGDLMTVELTTASAVSFLDPALQTQFQEYLRVLAQTRSRERRGVFIDSAGSGAREIAVRYIVPSPAWKSSYRLIFGKTGQPTLEGWAIIDNTTGEDWQGVRLSLVSGRPISFLSPIYEPRYVNRPVADLPDEYAQAPVVHEATLQNLMRDDQVAGRAKAAPRMPMMAAAPAPAMEREAAPSSVAATAEGRDLGDLFEYVLPQPVTVRASESAMLPFLQQTVEARKLLVYTNHTSPHPTSAAELINKTGKTLDGGPITVFAEGAYGGEALMETLKSGDRRLISYAVDLGTRISTAFDARRDAVREIRVRRGVLTSRAAVVDTATYTIRNVDAQAKTLWIERPQRRGYTVLEPKPVETTASANRFEVKLNPGSEQKFVVREERVIESTEMLTNLTPDVLVTYASNVSLSAAARRQIEQIIGIKRRIADAEAARKQAQDEMAAIAQDQQRIRQNIDSLNRVSGQQAQVQAYARQLEEQEKQLAVLRDQAAQQDRELAKLRIELNQAIEAAEF